MSLIVIGGCPGTGKSTLAKTLAKQSDKGVHLETDQFFNFVANKIDPSTVKAHEQNETVLHAWCAAALVYSDSGYEVYIDGVIGPWWLNQIQNILGGFRYVMLVSDLNTCLERVAAREGQASATADVVRVMHAKFAEYETTFASHLVRTNGKDKDQVVHDFLSNPNLRQFGV